MCHSSEYCSGSPPPPTVSFPLSLPLPPTPGGCPSLLSIVQQYPQCIYLEDCSGLQCIPAFGYVHSATAVVEKCQDPVTAELTLERNGQTVFQQVFDSSDVVENGLHLWVEMNRNDTHLDLSVKVMDTIIYIVFCITSSFSFSCAILPPSQLISSNISPSSLLPLPQVH